MLDYKNSWYSFGDVYKNPPFYSSQKCNRCKHISALNREKGSEIFQCVKCGYREHADLNASDNHEEDGLASLLQQDGWTKPTKLMQNPDSTKKRWTKRLRNSRKGRKVVALTETSKSPTKVQVS